MSRAPLVKLHWSSWNRHWRNSTNAILIPVAVFLMSTGLFLGHTHLSHSLTAPPSVTGDSPIYDALGWELSQGHGFVIVADNPDFLKPYQQAGTAAGLRLTSGIVVDRPPLYPLLLAVGNRLFGRQFWFARVLQGLLMGIVAAMVARLTYRLAGPCPALLSGVLFTVVDWRTRWSTREVLTESLACFLVMLLALALLQAVQSGRLRWVVVAGGFWGLAILTRSMAVLWWPLLVMGLLCLLQSWPLRKRVVAVLALTLTGCLVCLPWWSRTCRVLEEFRPLGLQGAEQFSAAYSDLAFRRLGMWYNLDQEGFFDSLPSVADPVEKIKQRAEFSTSKAREWIAAHPFRAMLLWPLRLLQELRPHGPGDLFVLVFALLGMGLYRRHPAGQVGLVLFISQGVAIAATWSVAGRFLYPLLGVLHVFAGVGLWASLLMLIEQRERTRAYLENPELFQVDSH